MKALTTVRRYYADRMWLGVLVVILCLTLRGMALSQGNIYYVAPNGDDSASGSATQPWKTIQKAANTLVAGETVYVRAGTYNERVIPQNSGLPGQYIAYVAYPGETVTIDGSTVSLPTNQSGLFQVLEKSYIKVSGFHIVNAGPNSLDAGILVHTSSYVIVEQNYTYNTVSSGIGVWYSNNIVIDGNEVERACNDGSQEAISVAATGTFEVKNNYVHDGGPGTNGGEGIDAKYGSHDGLVYKNEVHHMNRLGIYVDAYDQHTYNIDVFQNLVHDNVEGLWIGAEAGGLLEHIKSYNNIAYHNAFRGLGITSCCSSLSAHHPMNDIQIINNTIYGNLNGGIDVYNPDVTNIVIRNNIASQNKWYQILPETGVPDDELSIDHNLIDGYRGVYPRETRGTQYVEGDPSFVNAASADFHLQANSPAVNAGLTVGAPSVDFNGYPRDHLPDIGAYELRLVGSGGLYLPVILKSN